MKSIVHPDTFSVDSIVHPDTPPIVHPDTRWPFKPAPRLRFRIRNYARASLTLLKAFNACGAGVIQGEQRLPFGILPSPRRLRRRPAAGVLPASSGAPTAPDASTELPRGDGRGTPRESDARRVVWRAMFHPWRDPLRVSQPHVRINAIFCDLMRRYAPICDLLRFYAAAPSLSVYERKSAYMCFCVDGKMCIPPVRGKPRPTGCRPYSRFALDVILLCEAHGSRCGGGACHGHD